MARERDDDDDRPKKSWREIDQMRDQSAHRREDRSTQGPARKVQRSQAYRSYKSQLSKLFDGGSVPDALKKQLQEKGVAEDAAKKAKAVETILEAKDESAIIHALEIYQNEYGFPDDEEVLTKFLNLIDTKIILKTIQTLEILRGEGRLKRMNSFKARLKTVEMTIDDPEIQQAAKNLLKQL